ncbi:NAD(P)H dehydrogenase (quinone) [Haloechinothrix alba]|uniref:NAD(P)H dehydrogenase (Quinone) n=1 Tax=Haloechinothrix alba TaxID=664784 RepID=A0A238W5W0_9PSEU|nr:NAD(P)H:quinone oxidoreductase [Haloechinothrix alba]SNR41942.1 NAD(P)H dehydrogenase (quinone) [Haloechinothrix alba]
MNQPVKLSVIYYSATGTIAEMASVLAKTAEAEGAEVRVRRAAELAPDEAIDSNPAWRENVESTRHIPEATPDDVVWADAVVFGSPTRYGNVAAQLKQFLDTLGPQWQQGLLADKVYSGFVSSATRHGGQESTLLALYNTIHHFGGIIASPGYTDPAKFVDGNPYGTSHVDGNGQLPVDEDTRTAASVQGKRVVAIAAAMTNVRAA